ncbi:MAG TPA: glycosyltransferase, partial [Thermomicrobiales bacterium]|nr:glycosyltransferase [Thermomicrobiales bacterium]
MVETAAEAAWRPLFQQTIDDYYQGKLDEGREACERLLSLADLPPDIRQQARRNAIFYAPPLAEWVPGLRTLPLVTSVPAGWSTFNPSIAAAPDGFRMILRSSNYVVTPRLVYTANDPAGVIRTQNYLLTLDADLQVRDVAPISDRAVAPNREPPIFPVVGFEDCRLLLDGETWRVVGTSREWNPGGICQMALMRLDGAKLHDLRLLNDPAPGIHEKNWMPAVTLDGLRFIYSSRPTVLLRVDETSGATEETIWREAPEIAVDFHGGSQAIPVDGGWLCVIHEGVNFDDGGRVYPHRFLWFDADWNLSRCSRQFFWRERGIEFCAGLARDGDRLVASFGAWDREAYLAEMPLAEALALLRPFAPPAVAVEAPRLHVAAPSAPPAVEPEPVGDQPKPTIDGVTPFPASTRLAAVTLAGNNERLIRDALRSVVDWVDACIVLDTGSTDRTLKIARAVAGDKLVVQSFPWIDDFAAARNAALDAAAEWGADWAVILDTDERIELRGVDIRAALAGAEVDVASIAYADGSYAKERFFRMPARGRYFGPTHEAYFHNGRRGDLAGPIFTEEPKSAEGYRRKAERDVAILTRHTAANPDDPRWFYYLADSLETLGRREEAIAAWEQCWSLKGWDEEGAWAMYRAARCWLELKNHDRAIEACAAGMA